MSFRLTPDERDELDRKRRLSGLTLHEFIMALLRRRKIIVRPGADLLIVQIKRIGNNLNQLTYRANAGQIRDCRTELQQIRSELEKIRNAWQ